MPVPAARRRTRLRAALLALGRRRAGVPDASLQTNVEAVRRGVFQLSDLEYGLLLGLVLARAPANVLVFGLGADSELWTQANDGGRTVFLEDLSEYMRPVAGAETWRVTYPGFELPAALTGIRWDVIFVDGPKGRRPEQPGRRESIGAAAALAGTGCWLFVHDYDRPSERAWCDELLGAPVHTVDRTALFRAE